MDERAGDVTPDLSSLLYGDDDSLSLHILS